MEKLSNFSTAYDSIHLPPGFRFHPTDEELITHYLSPKVIDNSFISEAIGDVDLNKVEPWDLPWKAKMGEKEWYFFCVRDRKYPTGLRTNRATDAGYWKATGKDKEIFRQKILVGMKKTLVFYRGRAPKGEKTNWVMHEYRLEGNHSMIQIPKTTKNEWVISRIFKKSSGGKKIHISGLMKNREKDSQSLDLPPLMEFSNDENQVKPEESLVTCFSNPMEETRVDKFTSSSSSSSSYKNFESSQYSFNFPIDSTNNESSVLSNLQQKAKSEFSAMNTDISLTEYNYDLGFKIYEDQELPFICSGPVDLDCLWNY